MVRETRRGITSTMMKSYKEFILPHLECNSPVRMEVSKSQSGRLDDAYYHIITLTVHSRPKQLAPRHVGYCQSNVPLYKYFYHNGPIHSRDPFFNLRENGTTSTPI